MIDQFAEGGEEISSAIHIPFPAEAAGGGKEPVYLPNGNNVLLDYERPAMAGGLHLPLNKKPLDTLVATVKAVGPKCEHIKVGDHVVLLTKALIGGESGLLVDGRTVYLTQEQVIIAVIAPEKVAM